MLKMSVDVDVHSTWAGLQRELTKMAFPRDFT